MGGGGVCDHLSTRWLAALGDEEPRDFLGDSGCKVSSGPSALHPLAAELGFISRHRELPLPPRHLMDCFRSRWSSVVNEGESTVAGAAAEGEREGGRGAPEADAPPLLGSLEPRREWLRCLRELGNRPW